MRGVAGLRFSMSSYSTSLLWTVRRFMHSGGERKTWGSWPPPLLRPRAPPQPSPLTGPEAAVGAHQSHDDTAGQGPGDRRHGGERPFHMKGHPPHTLHRSRRPGRSPAPGQLLGCPQLPHSRVTNRSTPATRAASQRDRGLEQGHLAGRPEAGRPPSPPASPP